jgi:hypothetical protein
MNPIQPLTSRREISVVEPVSPALAQVKRVLFQPFDLGKWFVIGFCAWLACLGEQGGGAHAGFNSPGGRHGGSADNLRYEFEHAKNYVLSNLDWIVPLAVFLVVIGLGFGLLIFWLSSRGKFMFLHCTALNRAEVARPWSEFAREGNSLFLFRLVLALTGLVLFLPLVGLIIVLIVRMVQRGEADVGSILGAAAFVSVFIGLAIGFGIVRKLTTDFVVPIMFLRRNRCLHAWRELWSLLSANAAQFILYFLFSIVLALAIGMVVVVVAIATCCCCCLLLVPYVGAVLLLPILMFQRCYSLYFLAQFGPEYDVFPRAPVASPAPGLPPMPVPPSMR